MRDTVVFDIDGVLCDCSQALHDFIAGDPTHEQWDSEWFPRMGEHAPHRGWWTANRLMWPSCHIVLLTNRPERIRDITEAWLHEHKVGYNELIMRPEGTRYSQGKRERLKDLMETHRVVLAIDDDPTQVEIFREAGVPVIHAHNGLDATYWGTL